MDLVKWQEYIEKHSLEQLLSEVPAEPILLADMRTGCERQL